MICMSCEFNDCSECEHLTGGVWLVSDVEPLS